MELEEVRARLAAMEGDDQLLAEDNLGARCEALDEIDYLVQRVARRDLEGEQLRRRLLSLQARLAAINESLYARLRHRLRAGRLHGTSLRALLERHSSYPHSSRRQKHLQSEPADFVVDGILRLDAFTGEPTVQHPQMIHLEDTPVSVLLDLVDHVQLGPDDVFVDLGSGLGRAVLLVHWLTGVRARGIEVQPGYCAHARRLAAEYRAESVCFVQGDARHADLSPGTVFYLFTPFKGRVLRTVIERLRILARERPITLCTYGAVSLVVAQEPWLRPYDADGQHPFALGIWRSC
jgi:hypothetical protein